VRVAALEPEVSVCCWRLMGWAIGGFVCVCVHVCMCACMHICCLLAVSYLVSWHSWLLCMVLQISDICSSVRTSHYVCCVADIWSIVITSGYVCCVVDIWSSIVTPHCRHLSSHFSRRRQNLVLTSVKLIHVSVHLRSVCVLDCLQVETVECIWAKWGLDKLHKEQLNCLHCHSFIR
jgi:hypothetical protein